MGGSRVGPLDGAGLWIAPFSRPRGPTREWRFTVV